MPAFQRTCDRCRSKYQARRTTSRFCSASCRSAAARQRRAAEVPAAAVEPTREEISAGAGGPPRTQVEQMVRRQLQERGCLETVDGQSAIALAIQIDERAPGLAALITSLRATLQLALDGGRAADPADADDGDSTADPIIQLEERREQRRRRTAK